MSKKRLSASAAALILTIAGLAGIFAASPASPASAAGCAAAWSASAVYTGGTSASYNGHNWSAKWWTQGEAPSTGGSGVWEDKGSCDGGGSAPGNPSTPSGFVVSEAQFNQMFPNRKPFYTYAGLTTAMGGYAAFATTGDATVQKREMAAFLANVSHESGGLQYVEELDRSAWGNYCDSAQPYGCPAGRTAYHGRGPLQISWNTNYNAAGVALDVDLLNDPDKVKTDAAVSWGTALWFWMSQSGAGAMPAHTAITGGRGFGETIRSINGSIECNGGSTARVQARVDAYKSFTGILGVDPGGDLSC
jgi:predicted chitinase